MRNGAQRVRTLIGALVLALAGLAVVHLTAGYRDRQWVDEFVAQPLAQASMQLWSSAACDPAATTPRTYADQFAQHDRNAATFGRMQASLLRAAGDDSQHGADAAPAVAYLRSAAAFERHMLAMLRARYALWGAEQALSAVQRDIRLLHQNAPQPLLDRQSDAIAERSRRRAELTAAADALRKAARELHATELAAAAAPGGRHLRIHGPALEACAASNTPVGTGRALPGPAVLAAAGQGFGGRTSAPARPGRFGPPAHGDRGAAGGAGVAQASKVA